MDHAHLHRSAHHRRPAATFRTRASAVALIAFATICSALACSGVGPLGKPVVFGDQTNIIIWDEARHTEHFIRNANFKSGADDFGFIAPTPGKPELSEASNQAFYTLANLRPNPPLPRVFNSFTAGALAAKSEVQVIQEADVAGYHATTLLSKDAHAINDWMNSHGYVSTPEVEKWAERYCSRGWYLTAYKVVDKTKLAASTGTVRMTFRTRRPFNPFYVPSTNIPLTNKGTLRVYFVSDGDYDAHIGFDDTWQIPQWTAPVPDSAADKLASEVKLPVDSIPDDSQVETFVDNNFPRPAADDIYFTKRVPASGALGHRSSSIKPLAMLPLFAGLGLLAVARRRRVIE